MTPYWPFLLALACTVAAVLLEIRHRTSYEKARRRRRREDHLKGFRHATRCRYDVCPLDDDPGDGT